MTAKGFWLFDLFGYLAQNSVYILFSTIGGTENYIVFVNSIKVNIRSIFSH